MPEEKEWDQATFIKKLLIEISTHRSEESIRNGLFVLNESDWYYIRRFVEYAEKEIILASGENNNARNT